MGNRIYLLAPKDTDVTSDVMNSHRADLVPVYSFGENELFQQVIFPDGSLGRRLQDLFKKIMGFAPCLFVGERMAFLPFKIPITIVGECAIIEHLATHLQPATLYTNSLLLLLQWEAQSQCQSLSHPPRRKSITITDCTWRPCPSYSMNTRPAMDSLKTTNSGSSRFLSFHLNCEAVFKKLRPCRFLHQHWML